MDYVHLFNTHLVHDVQCRIKFFRGPRLDIVTGPYSVSLPSHRILPHIGGGVFPWKGAVGYLLHFWIYRGKVDWGGFYPLLAEIMVSFEPTQQPCALQLTTTLVVRAVDSMGRGTRVGIVGGLNPPPPVHVYRRSFLSENRPKTSIPGQNFKHYDNWPPILWGKFQHCGGRHVPNI